jgi:hypothetical protein
VHYSITSYVYACILIFGLVKISIYEPQFGFEFQNQQVDRNWKNEYQAADRPPMDRGPSAASGNGQSDLPRRLSAIIRKRTVRRPSADRPRRAEKGAVAADLPVVLIHLFSLALFSPNTLLCRVCADGEVKLCADSPTACGNIPSTCLHHGIFKSCGFHQISSLLRLFGFPL